MMLRVDIISDVVCPWCVIGYKQLEAALIQEGCAAEIHWQPYELNPGIAEEGEVLREHLVGKYRMSQADAISAEERITDAGKALGFPFRFYEGMRIVNTFKAHQLIHWAALHERQHELKLTLFHCHFNRERDISDDEVLANACVEAGLIFEEASEVLKQELYADAVRQRQRMIISNGVQGVPAMIFNQTDLHVGALGTEAYQKIIQRHL